MRTLMILAYIAAMIGALVSHAVLPDDVAIHFGGDGQADNWAPKTVNTLLFAILHTAMFLMFWWIPKSLRRIPKELINLPNRDYWLREENIDEAIDRFSDLMYEFGAALLAFFALVTVLTTQANLRTPTRLDETSFLIVLVAFFAFTGWWCVRLYRAFRVP